MIVFDLTCAQGHVFEGWFKDSAAFDTQRAASDIICPVCADAHISKAPMAPRLSLTTRGEEVAPPPPVTRGPKGSRPGDRRRKEEMFHAPAQVRTKAEKLAAEAARALRALRQEVEKSCDYVGEKFAEEARKIHYGETEQRSIYGETTFDEAKELRDEGIEIQPLPRLPRENA